MEHLQNLHMHSTFCDGRNTPEETVQVAIERGFDSIGFSSHSYMYYTPSFAVPMKAPGDRDYRAEIRRLQKAYEGRIDIFCGLEFDMYSICDLTDYDYIIGSVHYLKIDGEPIGFDRSAEVVQSIINTHFGGDGMAYALAYYRTLAELPQYGKFDIIGHFDIITKHAEKVRFFDEEAPVYRRAALEAAEALAGKIPFFEVNTGAMSRYGRCVPYPPLFLMKELRRLGFGAIISSDCHDNRYLDFGFETARELLAEAGFRERYILTKTGFRAVEL
ncbi:MAG: histidinol-phosphatase HisJ family protein [Clostridia bacterium]|nr:histidinol-phosphatase HisJ family protein [Clostridia bacterium]